MLFLFIFMFFLKNLHINFNTAFFKNGVLNNDRRKIIMRYYRSKFWIDLFIIIPFVVSLRIKNDLL